MKNKPITIALLVTVLFVWGLVIYKIYGTLHGSNIERYVPGKIIPEQSNATADTYAIHSYIRDPFLAILTDTITAEPVPEIKPVKQHEKKVFNLPEYRGIIVCDKKKTAILKMDKKIYFVHEGERIQSLKIQKIILDSVVGVIDGTRVRMLLNKKKR